MVTFDLAWSFEPEYLGCQLRLVSIHFPSFSQVYFVALLTTSGKGSILLMSRRPGRYFVISSWYRLWAGSFQASGREGASSRNENMFGMLKSVGEISELKEVEFGRYVQMSQLGVVSGHFV